MTVVTIRLIGHIDSQEVGPRRKIRPPGRMAASVLVQMDKKPYAIGIIGAGWMGSMHCRAYREVAERFPESGVAATVVACADSLPGRAAEQAQRLGIAESTEDWRELLSDPAIDAVSIATRNDSHREIAIAAAEAGKHVFCEKPVGRTADDTAAIAAAARRNGVVTFVGFCYRWVPMIAYVSQLAASGDLGRIVHFRGQFMSNYGSSPLGLRTWRFDSQQSGFGVLGDLMSHVVDIALMLGGPISEVSSRSKITYRERPAPAPGADHFMLGKADDPKLPVTNDDTVIAQAVFESGATATLEASRILRIPTNEFGFTIYGSAGVASWQFRRLNELELYIPRVDPQRAGSTTIYATSKHPNHGRFAIGSGGSIDYDALQIIGAHNFLVAIAGGKSQAPDFESTLRVAQVNAAMARSWDSRAWEKVTATI